MDKIAIRGAREHNLKNIDLEIPREKLVVVTGVSGSGKSSLVFDTVYAEGQRRYLESLSTYARQFIEKLERPDVDEITGISPTIAIRQKNTVTSARSTVGTATEIYDYLRLLFARVGKTYCPDCNEIVRAFSPGSVADELIKNHRGKRAYILLPPEKVSRDMWVERRGYYLSRGYTRVYCKGRVMDVDEVECDDAPCEIYFLIDRLKISPENRSRMVESVELAFRESTNEVVVYLVEDDSIVRFNQSPVCPKCGRSFIEPTPLLFSFNNPFGACPDCRGFGDRMEFSEDLIVPDKGRSLKEKAIDPWSRERFLYFHNLMLEYCEEKGIPVDIPYSDLTEEQRELIFEGDEDFIGVIPFLEKIREKSYKKGHRFFARRYMDFTTCRSCKGGRLRKEAYYVKVGDFNIRDMSGMVPHELLTALDGVKLDERERVIAKDIVWELKSRLQFLIDVGLDYVTLNRLTRTLSGGEAQRINLANSLGANLVDALYVLDEPSIGLHMADNERLIKVLKKLRDTGNTVIVVEHDPDIILSSDYLIDLGPGAGENGGEILFSGAIAEAKKVEIGESQTLRWLFGERPKIEIKTKKRKPYGKVTLRGVHEHNLKAIDVTFPLGQLTCVTGVSGSGKSSLVVDVLYRLLSSKRSGSVRSKLKSFEIEGGIDRVLLVDQSPIGTTPRSNPITYIKGFSFIREIFASQKTALMRGYGPGRFSFNKPGGRCSRCQGMGYRRVEMHFMADVFVPCEECEGKRYNRETLEVQYKGKNISDVLDMTVDEAIMFFDRVPKLGEKLWTLSKVGLGYLRLGQPSNTLSGGEAQRIKIARELVESQGERNLYIMDEPTTGLHMSDVMKLLKVLDELVDAGHTVIVIEHNMEVIRFADYIIDLGPGGGDNGGKVVARGTPMQIMKSSRSITGRYLKRYLAKYGGA